MGVTWTNLSGKKRSCIKVNREEPILIAGYNLLQ